MTKIQPSPTHPLTTAGEPVVNGLTAYGLVLRQRYLRVLLWHVEAKWNPTCISSTIPMPNAEVGRLCRFGQHTSPVLGVAPYLATLWAGLYLRVFNHICLNLGRD